MLANQFRVAHDLCIYKGPFQWLSCGHHFEKYSRNQALMNAFVGVVNFMVVWCHNGLAHGSDMMRSSRRCWWPRKRTFFIICTSFAAYKYMYAYVSPSQHLRRIEWQVLVLSNGQCSHMSCRVPSVVRPSTLLRIESPWLMSPFSEIGCAMLSHDCAIEGIMLVTI